jgi:hypothetical protein
MHCTGRTFVRLSAENRSRLDRSRRHRAISRDRLVNESIADYLDSIYTESRLQLVMRRRRRAA